MDSKADTPTGLATPPLPAAQPLVYITGSPTANTQCVAEYLALLLGDEAILIDHPYPTTWTPPPPSSTPPTTDQTSPSSTRPRPRTIRLPSRSSRSHSLTITTPAPTTTPFSDPLLATLASHPLRTAILTSTKPPADNTTVASRAATQTGRPLIRVRLAAGATPTSSAPPTSPTSPAASSLTLPDADSGGDPHAAALRIVEYLREINARRRSHGDWEAVNDNDDDSSTAAGRQLGGGEGLGEGGFVCGVITPVLTPAEERGEIRF